MWHKLYLLPKYDMDLAFSRTVCTDLIKIPGQLAGYLDWRHIQCMTMWDVEWDQFCKWTSATAVTVFSGKMHQLEIYLIFGNLFKQDWREPTDAWVLWWNNCPRNQCAQSGAFLLETDLASDLAHLQMWITKMGPTWIVQRSLQCKHSLIAQHFPAGL